MFVLAKPSAARSVGALVASEPSYLFGSGPGNTLAANRPSLASNGSRDLGSVSPASIRSLASPSHRRTYPRDFLDDHVVDLGRVL